MARVENIKIEDITVMILGDIEVKPPLTVELKVTDNIINRSKMVVMSVGKGGDQPLINTVSLPYSKIAEHGFLETKMAELARGLAYCVYEYDPRIGTKFGTSVPTCPLFDPSYLKSSIDECMEKIKNNQELDEDSLKINHCHICGSMNDENSWWGGGNILFVHETCLNPPDLEHC